MTVRDVLLSIELEGGERHGGVFYFADYCDLDVGALRLAVFDWPKILFDPPDTPTQISLTRTVVYRYSGRVSESGRLVYVPA